MELLQWPEERGYPVDYLLSRIRGRRSKLITDWKALLFDITSLEYVASGRYRGFVSEKSPEGAWKLLMKEYRWVYTQMNRSLREIFSPFFLYSELRTLFICLRHREKGKTARIDEILASSLLSERIIKVLQTSEDLPSAVAHIERILLSLSDGFGGLTEILETDGLRGVEQRITNSYLVYAMHKKLHPLMKMFFVRIIDSRNILSCYKYLRLNAKAEPVFIPGGSIAETQLRETAESLDMRKIGDLIHEFSGIKLDTFTPSQVETSLYKGITRFLKKTGREPLGIGLILDYLWRCSIEAMNLGVLLYGKDLETDQVTAELVQ